MVEAFRDMERVVESSRRVTEQMTELRYWTEVGKAARELLDQAGRERARMIRQAHADGMTLTTLASMTDLSVTRVAQLIARADDLEGDD